MTNKKLILSAVTMVLLATSGISFAREASEGPRGEGKGHKNSIEVNSMVLAREASEGPRGEGKGHKNSVDVNGMILAREATEAPRGADNNNHRQRGRNKLSDDAGSMILAREGGCRRKCGALTEDNTQILAREASEGPRGEGKGHKNSVDASGMILAREATEAPRGADNNNHRQRGRNKLTDDAGQFILAREASEGPRGEGKGHKHGVDLAVLA